MITDAQEISKLWDRHILWIWFNYPNCRVKRALQLFLQKHPDVDRDVFLALPKVPSFYIGYADFRLWVNRNMFSIWEKLFSIDKEDILERVAILKRLAKITKDCKGLGPNGKAETEILRLRRENRQNVFGQTAVMQSVSATYEKHRRSNQWNVCK